MSEEERAREARTEEGRGTAEDVQEAAEQEATPA
jgi:hypothetical protein